MTLNAWSVALGLDFHTLKKRLLAAGVEIKPRKTYCARVVFRAWTGDKEQAQAREANARAEILEHKLRIERGELFSSEEWDKRFNQFVMPIRARLLSMPAECAVNCNPADPQFARAALDLWVKENLPKMREAVEKANSSNDDLKESKL